MPGYLHHRMQTSIGMRVCVQLVYVQAVQGQGQMQSETCLGGCPRSSETPLALSGTWCSNPWFSRLAPKMNFLRHVLGLSSDQSLFHDLVSS